MRIGFCGAQRVGKSTLAKAVADKLGLPFIATPTKDILEHYGYNAREQYGLLDRFASQVMVLSHLQKVWEANEHAVFDRTPLDVLAYMEADVVRDFPPLLESNYADYRQQCLKLADLFDYIFLVQPGITIIDDPRSAPPSMAYMTHLNSLMYAYCAEAVCTNRAVLPANVLPLTERVTYVEAFINP